MGVGYFQGCRPVVPESIPLRILETNPYNPSNFFEILETLGAEVAGSASRNAAILAGRYILVRKRDAASHQPGFQEGF